MFTGAECRVIFAGVIGTAMIVASMVATAFSLAALGQKPGNSSTNRETGTVDPICRTARRQHEMSCGIGELCSGRLPVPEPCRQETLNLYNQAIALIDLTLSVIEMFQ